MITLNYRDAQPIYEQIKDGMRRLIVTGAIATGERLPSVRELASQLAINPNTIQRAYRELENEGYILSVVGKGSFAADLKDVDQTHQREVLARFERAVAELLQLGVPAASLHAQIDCAAGKEAGK